MGWFALFFWILTVLSFLFTFHTLLNVRYAEDNWGVVGGILFTAFLFCVAVALTLFWVALR